MNVQKCIKGHFFDTDLFIKCPVCGMGTSGKSELQVEDSSEEDTLQVNLDLRFRQIPEPEDENTLSRPGQIERPIAPIVNNEEILREEVFEEEAGGGDICLSCFKKVKRQEICPCCGKAMMPNPKEIIHLIPGTMLAGRYIIGQSVGSGGFGIVYKAWDTRLEMVVAIKEFFISHMMTRVMGNKEVIISKRLREEYVFRKQRFLAEARNMAKFDHHDNIPNVYEFFEENDTAYIVMELLEGITLQQYYREKKEIIDQDLALLITNEVGNALGAMHAKGILHRDVAPNNIFLCRNGEIRVKLMDLGAAKLADTESDIEEIILKPGFSPIEQYDNSNHYGPWTDVYALGATLYMMLTGVKPPESTNRKIEDTLKAPAQINPEISENMDHAIMRAMAVDYSERFQTVEEFLKALNSGEKVLSLEEELNRRRKNKRIGMMAALFVALALIVGTFTAIWSQRRAQILRPAVIDVWYCDENMVPEGQGSSGEKKAMESIKRQFEQAFDGVQIQLQGYSSEDYQTALEQAARTGSMPDLFESTSVVGEVMELAENLDFMLNSEMLSSTLFLDQYDEYYLGHRRMPLAIEVPIACIITAGPVSVDYDDSCFSSLEDLGKGLPVAVDFEKEKLIAQMEDTAAFRSKEEFYSGQEVPILLGTTMNLNEIRNTLLDREKAYVFYDRDRIPCGFTYEWSIVPGTREEKAAAEKLLTWMMDYAFQRTLMIDECQDGQLPLNEACFLQKISSQHVLEPLKEIYKQFTFER